jgi:hypothetical protein
MPRRTAGIAETTDASGDEFDRVNGKCAASEIARNTRLLQMREQGNGGTMPSHSQSREIALSVPFRLLTSHCQFDKKRARGKDRRAAVLPFGGGT